MTPILRFPEFTGQWRKGTLGEFFTFKNGVNAEKGMYGRGRKFINVMDVIAESTISYDSIIGSVDISDREFAKNEVKYGDILFQRSSETRAEVGQSNVYLDQVSATFGGFVIRGRPKAEIDSRYFNALLKTSAVRKDMTSRSGGSTRYNIGQEALEAVTVHISPFLEEQRKIANFLGLVDERIKLLQRRRDALTRYKAGVMQRLFGQSLRFARDNGDAFPEWEEKQLGDIARVNPKSGPLPAQFKYIDLESVKSGKLAVTATIESINAPERAQRVVQDGDILFQTVRPYQMNNLYFEHGENYVASTGYAQIRAKIDPKFLFQQLLTQTFVREVIRRCTGSSYPAINSSDLAKIIVNVPHPDEQRKISGVLSDLDEKVLAVSTQADNMKAVKESLLQQMFV